MIRSSLCLGASCQPWEEQPLQPCHQNVNLRHVGVKEFGGDSRTERPAGDLLPCEPGVDDGFGLGELREAFFGRGNPGPWVDGLAAGGLALLVGFAFLSGLTLRVGIRAFLLGWRGF